MDRDRLGPIATRKDCHVAPFIPQFTGKLLNHRSFARPTHRQIPNRNYLDAQRRVAQNSKIVKKPPRLNGNLEDFGKPIGNAPDNRFTKALSLLENNLQKERFACFHPSPKLFAHLKSSLPS